MKTKSSKIEDTVYWLTVVMRQAQSDLKKQSEKIIELENQIKRLKNNEYPQNNTQNNPRTILRGNTRS